MRLEVKLTSSRQLSDFYFDNRDPGTCGCSSLALGARQARKVGKALPPLFCVPVLVKDNIDTEGMVATGGSIALMDNFPQRDAQPVG